MIRKLAILGAVVASLVLALGATEASAKGGMGGKWGKGGIGLGIGAGIALGVGLAAIAARSSDASTCYRERFVSADGDVIIRRICE